MAVIDKHYAELQARVSTPEFLVKFAHALVKVAQYQDEAATPEPDAEPVIKRKGPPGGPPKPEVRMRPSSHLDYSRSLVRQLQVDPEQAALLRAFLMTPVGMALGGAAGYLGGNSGTSAAIGALLGGTGLGAAGYFSGKGEAESENSRILAQRRFGINTAAEREFVARYPLPGATLTDTGRKL